MPGKTNKKNTKPPAGNSGLDSETNSQEQNPDQNMNHDASSIAAQQLPPHETQADESDATIKAFDELFDTSDWLPWPGTVYAVPQYPAVPDFFFVPPSEWMNMIG